MIPKIICSELLHQQTDVTIQLSAFQCDNTVRRAEVIANTAGVEKKGRSPMVYQGLMSMAKEKEIKVLLFGCVSGS